MPVHAKRPVAAHEFDSASMGASRPMDVAGLVARLSPEGKKAAADAAVIIKAGNAARNWRMKMGWTQKQMADAIGSTQAHISTIERGLGENGPTVGMLARIAEVCGRELVIEGRPRAAPAAAG